MTVASRLQAGGQALQVFKGGKPIESFLYKDMAGWQDEEGEVYIELNSGRELLYTLYDGGGDNQWHLMVVDA